MKTKSARVSATVMANHLGLSRTYLERLVADGTMSKDDQGRFGIDETRMRYIRALREARRASSATSAQARLHEAKARRVELENGTLERRLMQVDEHLQTVDAMAGLLLTKLNELPARIGGQNLTLRRKAEKVVFDIRKEIADEAGRRAAEYADNGAATDKKQP
jgi:hypothetical protein